MQFDDKYFSDAPAPPAATNMDPALFSDEPAKSEKSLGGLAQNAVSDVGDMAGNIATLGGNLLSHPVDTTAAVVKGLPGALKSWAQELGIPEAMHGKFGEALNKFGESAYEHPVSRALDVASVAMPALKGMGVVKAGELGAEGGKIADMAGEASNALGRRELGFTKRLLNTTGKMGKADEATEWANKSGLMDVMDDADSRLSKTQGLKNKAWDTMAETYKDPELTGKSLNAQSIVDSLDQMRPRDASGKVLTGGDWAPLNDEIDKKIATIKAYKGDIPWENAQDLKNAMKQSTKWELTQPTTINDLRKRLSGTFRGGMDQQLEDAIGEDKMGAYNAAKNDYGNSKNIIRALENKISSKAGNRLGGLTDFIAGGAGMAHGGPLGAMAVVAGKKIIERYGMAAGSKLLSNVARGKYAGAIAHAATLGPAELSTTLHLIADKDPQFAQELAAQGDQR